MLYKYGESTLSTASYPTHGRGIIVKYKLRFFKYMHGIILMWKEREYIFSSHLYMAELFEQEA